MNNVVVDEKSIVEHEPCNYYGALCTATDSDGKFYWSVDNWDGHYWAEIPESLYTALIEFRIASK